MIKRRNTIIWVVVFGLAMGYLEAAVVVYLREIYYPRGFSFPLVPVSGRDLVVETVREIATLLMLVAVGMLSGRSGRERLAFFLLAFGLWDVVYYLTLKAILGWPQHIGEHDLLFLIPVPWIGPVWAPVVLSVTMIVLAASLLRQPGAGMPVSAALYLLIPGALLVIVSFTLDALNHLLPLSRGVYIPSLFKSWIFWAGEALLAAGTGFIIRSKKTESIRPRQA